MRFVQLRLPSYLLLLGSVLFLGCLWADALTLGEQACPGWAALLLGWAALRDTPAALAWLANPALFAAWVLQRNGAKSAALIASAVAWLLVASAWILIDAGPLPRLPGSSAAPATQALGPGYWLWFASASCGLIARAIACMPTDHLSMKDSAR